MKIVVPKIELKVVQALLSKSKNSKYFSLLDEHCFHYPPARESYKRSLILLKSRGNLPSWDEVIHDPVIEQDNRTALQKYQSKPIKSGKKVKELIQLLHKYKKKRILIEHSRYIQKSIKSDSADVDKLIERSNDILARAKVNSGETRFFRIGLEENTNKIVRRLLTKPKRNRFLRTGFNAFDSINSGLFRSALVVLSGQTGAGKSTLIGVLSRNFASQGAKVGVVTLEMDEEEQLERRLAQVSRIPLTDIINPRERLSKKQLRKAIKKFEDYNESLRKKGGQELFYPPDDDVSMSDVLFTLKPHDFDVIIIDYISLLKDANDDKQWQRLGEVTRQGKIFAKNNDCIVILLAQLSEELKVRYARSIKEHANNLWSWGRTDLLDQHGIMEINQEKARKQKMFKFYLKCEFEYMDIRDVNKEELNIIKAAKEVRKKGEKKHESTFI